MNIWEITSPVAIVILVAAAGLAAYWFRGRRRDAIESLDPSAEPKLSVEAADRIRFRLIGDGFLAVGALILLFLVLRLIFG